jgi:hypothetical protein
MKEVRLRSLSQENTRKSRDAGCKPRFGFPPQFLQGSAALVGPSKGAFHHRSFSQERKGIQFIASDVVAERGYDRFAQQLCYRVASRFEAVFADGF